MIILMTYILSTLNRNMKIVIIFNLVKRNDSDISINNIFRDNSMINQSNFQYFLSREPSMLLNNDENIETKNLQFFPNINIRNGIISYIIIKQTENI